MIALQLYSVMTWVAKGANLSRIFETLTIDKTSNEMECLGPNYIYCTLHDSFHVQGEIGWLMEQTKRFRGSITNITTNIKVIFIASWV